MPGFELLRDLLILVAVAIPVVAIAQRLRAPTVVGFLITGIAIGPHALGLVRDVEAVRGLADIGVVLLLFAVGLELSLSRLMRMGRTMVVGGLLQVAGSAGVVAGLAVLAGAAPDHAVVYGALVALSSTAIVLKTYTDRGELDTPHGRVVVAILLFQDLCVIPLVLLVRVLGARDTGFAGAAHAVGLGLVVIGALVFGGRLVIPWALERLVRLRNRELLTLGIVFIGLAAAYITASFGLSLALGAFIAGLVIAESEYGIQALSDVLPFRDVFSGVFFTSVGMLFDPAFMATHGAAVAAAAGGILLLKTGTGTAATRALRRSTQVAVTAGVGLAQVGEFSFVLAGVALPLGLLTHDGYQLFLAASVLSMVIAPFAIAGARPFGALVARLVRAPVVPITPVAEAAHPLRDHVIVVGYGVNGRNLARVLRAAAIPYVILEQNGQVVRRARAEGEPIIFGDATRAEVLERVGIRVARVVVFAISAPAEELRGVAVARHLNAGVRIVVRTRYVASIGDLERAGADEVVPEEFETSIEIFARVLALYGIPDHLIAREVDGVREAHYGALRGRGGPDLRLDRLRHLGALHAVEMLEVAEGAPAVGGHPTTLDVRRKTGATVVAVIRQGAVHFTPDPAFRFRPLDAVVVVGDREALDRVRPLFADSESDGTHDAPGNPDSDAPAEAPGN